MGMTRVAQRVLVVVDPDRHRAGTEPLENRPRAAPHVEDDVPRPGVRDAGPIEERGDRFPLSAEPPVVPLQAMHPPVLLRLHAGLPRPRVPGVRADRSR